MAVRESMMLLHFFFFHLLKFVAASPGNIAFESTKITFSCQSAHHVHLVAAQRNMLWLGCYSPVKLPSTTLT